MEVKRREEKGRDAEGREVRGSARQKPAHGSRSRRHTGVQAGDDAGSLTGQGRQGRRR
jgi:hypothetical protein